VLVTDLCHAGGDLANCLFPCCLDENAVQPYERRLKALFAVDEGMPETAFDAGRTEVWNHIGSRHLDQSAVPDPHVELAPDSAVGAACADLLRLPDPDTGRHLFGEGACGADLDAFAAPVAAGIAPLMDAGGHLYLVAAVNGGDYALALDLAARPDAPGALNALGRVVL